jgi:hypothetical protein
VKVFTLPKDLTHDQFAMVPPLQRRGEARAYITFRFPVERGDRCAAAVGDVSLLKRVKGMGSEVA